MKIMLILSVCFMISSCSQSQEKMEKQSLDDVYFFLSNYNIVTNSDQIHLTSFKKLGNGEYDFKYIIKNDSNLWIVHSYDEKNYTSTFFYDVSNEINDITDSINFERRKNNDFPLNKRWDWVGKVSK